MPLVQDGGPCDAHSPGQHDAPPFWTAHELSPPALIAVRPAAAPSTATGMLLFDGTLWLWSVSYPQHQDPPSLTAHACSQPVAIPLTPLAIPDTGTGMGLD